MGLVRHKSDKIDAERISKYCMRYHDNARIFSVINSTITALSYLQNERETIKTHRATYLAQLTDTKNFISKIDYENKKIRYTKIITNLTDSINIIDEQIKALIYQNKIISNQYELLLSVDGCGPVLALKMLIETNGFTKFKDSKSFCCHAGIVPFNFTSGTSIRSKKKISRFSDRKLKSLLHLAAMSSIQITGSDMQKYYERKISEGKNKMLILNAVRCKLVYRMFS